MNSQRTAKCARWLLGLSTAASLVACDATDRPPTAPTTKRPGSGGTASAKAAPSVPLGVIVDDQGATGAYKIRSDGLGEYVDGQQGMFAEIDGFGNLQITPTNMNSSTPPERTLTFDYSAPIDPLNAYRPNDAGQWNFKIKSNKTNNGNPSITDLGTGGTPASGCYNVTIAHSNQLMQFVDDFNVATSPQSGYVYITRTNPGSSPATWTMTSDGPCQVNPSWAGVSSLDLVAKHAIGISRGYFNQQFSVHLRALP